MQGVPHQAVVQVRAFVNEQQSDGTWSPRATFNDSFVFVLQGNTESEVVEQLQQRLQELKDKWQEMNEKDSQN